MVNRNEAHAWVLFRELDEHAARLDATTSSMLDVAAAIVSTYLWRLHAELEAQGVDSAIDLAIAERKGWELFQERTRSLILCNPNGPVH